MDKIAAFPNSTTLEVGSSRYCITLLFDQEWCDIYRTTSWFLDYRRCTKKRRRLERRGEFTMLSVGGSLRVCLALLFVGVHGADSKYLS